MSCLGLIGEGDGDAGGWLLVVVVVVVDFGSSGKNGEVVWFAGEVLVYICPYLPFVVMSDTERADARGGAAISRQCT